MIKQTTHISLMLLSEASQNDLVVENSTTQISLSEEEDL